MSTAKAASKQMEIEVKIAREDSAIDSGILDLGDLTPYTCPECHGVLVQIQEGRLVRFRCHTGHAYSLSTLLAALTESTENMLWSALRAMQESELLMSHLARHLKEANDSEAAEKLLHKAQEVKERTQRIRQAALENEIVTTDRVSGEAGSG